MNYYTDVLKQYAVFEGRASRTQYWMFVLINFIILLILAGIEVALGSPLIIYSLYQLAVLVPTLAVTVRRLHDSGKSGWWILIGLVPFIGAIILLVLMVIDSEPGENRFGPNPKGA
jgi:uncharacterized membrane protein YhaH (DUF805 family)